MYTITKEQIEEILELLQHVQMGVVTKNNKMAFQVFVELLKVYDDNKDKKQIKERE